jgi:hypothetical protein
MSRQAPPSPLSERDRRQLEARGIAWDEAVRQLELLRSPPPSIQLVRPCTPGDGIETLAEADLPALAQRHRAAAERGDVGAFVPASGAATRMFRELIVYRDDPRPLMPVEIQSDAASGRADAAMLLEFLDYLHHFAFLEPLERTLEARGQRLEALRISGPVKPILAALLDADGLGYATLPKGLVPFHLGRGGPRAAFQEHLAEAAALHADTAGRVHVHATVPADRGDQFRAVIERESALERGEHGHAPMRDHTATSWDVTLSVQDPATDTLAIELSGEPFRDERGELVFRPAGHGALLGNLARASTPIVMLKNIDNVASEPYREPTLVWTRAIVGRLCALREQVRAIVRRLDDAGDDLALADAATLAHEIATDAPHRPNTREEAKAILDRPLRVCGMVKNTGEPGGGPYWVRGRDGRVTRQIVESAQVPPGDSEQFRIFRGATHFNPVFMACALDDAHGGRHDLARYADPSAVIVTRRSHAGRDLIALERPGLWNGSMAHWNTVFVEVPLAVFNPVKAVNDLLRPEHQPAR